MDTKKNNHLLPRLAIKRWKDKGGRIFDKELNKSRAIEKKDFSQEYYYSIGKVDDKLENRIMLFETCIGRIIAKLHKQYNEKKVSLSYKETEILKLYVALQSCRNDHTSPVIKADETGMYMNNHYLIGIPLIQDQLTAVTVTTIICNEFDRINALPDDAPYVNDAHEITTKTINSLLVYGLHLIIVNNDQNAFLVSETTAIIECTLDSDYLFTFIPVSPSIGIILAKSMYLKTLEDIEKTKCYFGAKYGNGTIDPYISEMISDNKLVYNFTPSSNGLTFEYVELDSKEIYRLNSIIYEDGKNILYVNDKALKEAKTKLDIRTVSYCI